MNKAKRECCTSEYLIVISQKAKQAFELVKRELSGNEERTMNGAAG
jgi:hypothetical protein